MLIFASVTTSCVAVFVTRALMFLGSGRRT
jgi:hypothetical protein